jgi:drug/metabolite transporter (DMT)-like permease
MVLEVALVAAIVAMVAWGIGDFLIQRSVRKIGDVETLAIIGVFGSLALAPWGVRFFIDNWEFSIFFGLVAFGLFFFIKSLVNFEALRVGKLSVVEIICEVELPIAVLLGFVLLNEHVTHLQIVLIAAVFVGVLLMALKEPLRPKHLIEKGALLALITAIFFGLTDYLAAYFARATSPIAVVWLPWVVFTIVALAVVAKRKNSGSFIKHVVKNRKLVLWMAFLDVGAWVLYAFALLRYKLAIITAITESYVAVALILGLWINKERIKIHQFVGAVVAFISSIVLVTIS